MANFIKVDPNDPKEVKDIQIEMNKLYRKLENKGLSGEERQILLDQLNDKRQELYKKKKKKANVVPVYKNNIVSEHDNSTSQRLYNDRYVL